MSNSNPAQTTFRARSRARDERLCRILIAVTTVFFLPVAMLIKLASFGTSSASGEVTTSVFADAKGMASSIIPFIFMG
jgi:hypothetical protein